MSTLQTRMANRTETAVAADTCSLLRMAVGCEELAVPIEDVREILQVVRMTPLPRTPSFVRGVMNLRGSVVPVVDLATRLGHGHTDIGRRSCVVVVEVPVSPDHDGEVQVKPVVMGLLVDAVFDVFDRSAAEIEPAPAIGTVIAAEYLRGMTRASGQLIGVLALERVLSTHDLAQLIANHCSH